MASGVILALDSRRQTTANGGGVSGRLAVAGELSDSSPWLKYHLEQLPDRVYQDAAYRKVHNYGQIDSSAEQSPGSSHHQMAAVRRQATPPNVTHQRGFSGGYPRPARQSSKEQQRPVAVVNPQRRSSAPSRVEGGGKGAILVTSSVDSSTMKRSVAESLWSLPGTVGASSTPSSPLLGVSNGTWDLNSSRTPVKPTFPPSLGSTFGSVATASNRDTSSAVGVYALPQIRSGADSATRLQLRSAASKRHNRLLGHMRPDSEYSFQNMWAAKLASPSRRLNHVDTLSSVLRVESPMTIWRTGSPASASAAGRRPSPSGAYGAQSPSPTMMVDSEGHPSAAARHVFLSSSSSADARNESGSSASNSARVKNADPTVYNGGEGRGQNENNGNTGNAGYFVGHGSSNITDNFAKTDVIRRGLPFWLTPRLQRQQDAGRTKEPVPTSALLHHHHQQMDRLQSPRQRENNDKDNLVSNRHDHPNNADDYDDEDAFQSVAAANTSGVMQTGGGGGERVTSAERARKPSVRDSAVVPSSDQSESVGDIFARASQNIRHLDDSESSEFDYVTNSDSPMTLTYEDTEVLAREAVQQRAYTPTTPTPSSSPADGEHPLATADKPSTADYNDAITAPADAAGEVTVVSVLAATDTTGKRLRKREPRSVRFSSDDLVHEFVPSEAIGGAVADEVDSDDRGEVTFNNEA